MRRNCKHTFWWFDHRGNSAYWYNIYFLYVSTSAGSLSKTQHYCCSSWCKSRSAYIYSGVLHIVQVFCYLFRCFAIYSGVWHIVQVFCQFLRCLAIYSGVWQFIQVFCYLCRYFANFSGVLLLFYVLLYFFRSVEAPIV